MAYNDFIIDGCFDGSKKLTQKESKKCVEKFLRNILGNENIRIIKINDNDFDKLYSLLKFHPNFQNKIQYGIEAFIVNITPKNYIQLSFVNNNDEKDDISWVKISQVLAGLDTKTLKLQTIHKAMRASIADQIFEFKEKHFLLNSCFISELSGEKLDENFVHVDHYKPTFYELANNWINLVGFDNIELVSLGCQLGPVLREDQRKNWSDYHRKYAKLRILSAKENLTRKRNS